MVTLTVSQFNGPSALLSNARSTIATLIQRPSLVTTSNAFDEFSILDDLIDVSNDVDRFEDGESRKFLNIAQVLSASTCIYSRRVDALYKLINNFQSSTSIETDDENDDDDDGDKDLNESKRSTMKKDDEKTKKNVIQEKKRQSSKTHRSFICLDPTKINVTETKPFFLDRSSMVDLKLFQNYVPMGNKQFWINDQRPMIFDLLFDHPLEEIVNDHRPSMNVGASSPPPILSFDDDLNDEIPLPLTPMIDRPDSFSIDEHQPQPSSVVVTSAAAVAQEKKKIARNRMKKVQDNEIDLNIFRRGLTDAQQALFRCHQMKSTSTVTKVVNEPTHFLLRTFHRKDFEALIKDCLPSIRSCFIYPTITIHHLTIRQRYSKIAEEIRPRSPAVPLTDVLDEENFLPLSSSPPMFSFLPDSNEDVDVRLQTDMNSYLDAALDQPSEEQLKNQLFLHLRSSILTYVNEHSTLNKINVDQLIDSLHDQYSLPLIFSQLLHLCASTQRYYLNSTDQENLFLEKR